MPKYISVLLIVISANVLSESALETANFLETESEKCLNEPFIATKFQEAIKLSQKSKYKGFIAFCQLAYMGDHRAQFKLAKIYLEGVSNKVPKNSTLSLSWSLVSNSEIVQKRKTDFINRLENQLEKKKVVDATFFTQKLMERVGPATAHDSAINKSRFRKIRKSLGTNIRN